MISLLQAWAVSGRTTLVLALTLGSAASSAAQTEAENLSTSFRQAARRVLPAVVTVRPVGGPSPIVGPDRFLRPDLPMPGADGPTASGPEPGGSGLVVDAEKGLVLTNDHVVQQASRVIVALPDGRQREARRVLRDPRSDLALLTIDPGGLEQADWGDSGNLEVGDWVLAIGQPFGLSGTVTAGIVSGTGRGLGGALFHEDLIQTDAAINPGNSGGPLVNLRGEVVGINLAFKSVNGGYEGVGFAVPSGRARRVAADLAEHGRVRRSYLGIEIHPVDAETAERLGQPGAISIAAVAAGSPADEAGIRPGDLLVAFQGMPTRGTGLLKSALEFAPTDEDLALTVDRDGRRVELRARPRSRDEEPPADLPPTQIPAPFEVLPGPIPIPLPMPSTGLEAAEPPLLLPEPTPSPAPTLPEPNASRSPTRFPELGLRLELVDDDLRRRFDLDPSVAGLIVVGVEPDGPSAQGGLEIGMVLTDAAGRRVTSLAEFRAALAGRPPGRDLLVRVLKGGRSSFRVIFDRSDPARSAPGPSTREDGPP